MTTTDEMEIYKSIQSKHGKKGGDATVKKLGSKGMSRVANARWAKAKGII